MKHSIAGIARKGDKILVAKRKIGGSLSEKWEFPGGKVEEGEDHGQAMVREWDEELEVSVETGRFLCSDSFVHKGIDFLLSAYEVKLLSEDFTLHEHTELRWLTMDEIEAMDLADSDRSLIDAMKKEL